MLAVGDAALGFWAALREVFPETREQRDWVHKVANVLDALPKGAQPAARRVLGQIRDAEDRAHAEIATRRFAELFGQVPKAVARWSMTASSCWVHLKKTSNPMESAFATVRLRTKVTKVREAGATGLGMMFKLLQAAQDHWRYVNGAHLVALVCAGAEFEKGVLVERLRTGRHGSAT